MTDVPLGKHVLEVRIAEVIEETADSRSLVFEIPDRAADKFAYAPGQYLTLRIPSDRTGSVARCYSLSSSPHLDDRLAVTVKRTADGYGSNWICDNAHAGMHMHVLAPSGVFVPKQLDNDFLLLAGGSGVTPMMAICKSALSQGSGKVVLIYANRDEQSVIFGAALRELAAKYPDRLTVIHWLESVQGLPSQQQLATLTAPFAEHEAFICGPGPFMDASEAALKGNGMPHDRVHIEFSAPGKRPVRRGRARRALGRRRTTGDRDRGTGRGDPRGQLATQHRATRRVTRQGPGRAVLLP